MQSESYKEIQQYDHFNTFHAHFTCFLWSYEIHFVALQIASVSSRF